AFVERREGAVKIAGVGTPTWHLATRRRHLAHRFAVTGHVGEHDQYVLIAFERQVFGDGEGDSGREDPLDDRVVGGVENEHEVARCRARLEHLAHRLGVGVGQSHAGDDDLEVLARDVGLRGDLGREFEVGQTCRGEDWEFLTAYQRRERVDHRDPGEDGIARHVASARVERRAVHGPSLSGEHRRPVADGDVEGPALEGDADEVGIDTTRSLEDFDDGDVAAHLEDEAVANLARGKSYPRDLVPSEAFGPAYREQGTADLGGAEILNRRDGVA